MRPGPPSRGLLCLRGFTTALSQATRAPAATGGTFIIIAGVEHRVITRCNRCYRNYCVALNMPATEKQFINNKVRFTVAGRKNRRWPSLVPQSLRFPGVVKCGPREGNLKAMMRPRNIMRDYALLLLIKITAAKE